MKVLKRKTDFQIKLIFRLQTAKKLSDILRTLKYDDHLCTPNNKWPTCELDGTYQSLTIKNLHVKKCQILSP